MYDRCHSLINKFSEIRDIVINATDSEKELLYEMLSEYSDFIQTKWGAEYFELSIIDDEQIDEYGVMLLDDKNLIFIDDDIQRESGEYISTLMREAQIFIPNRFNRVK